MPGGDPLLLAIDAGGTATRAVLARADGTIIGEGRGGPGNHMLAPPETARASLADAVTAALAAAGLPPGAVALAVAGSAGVGPGGEGREFVDAVVGDLLGGTDRLHVTGDMVTALWGALQPPVGVVVCAGTGSVCYGRTAEGAACQVGGWGPLMGDEGSAHDIALRGLRAVARATDGRAAPTLLAARLAAVLGAANPIEAAVRLYAEAPPRERIAALAVEVARAAADGDSVARGILAEAAAELALAAATVLRHLGLLGTPAAVSFAGAVFDAGGPLLDPFRAALCAAAPLAAVRPPSLPPLGGAVCLGLHRLGCPVRTDTVARLAAGLTNP